jgi:hypothetical protein
VEEETEFVPVPAAMSYQKAIEMLRSGNAALGPASR